MRIIQEKHGVYFYNNDEEYCVYTYKGNTIINRAIYNCYDECYEFIGNERMSIPRDVAYKIAKKIVEEYEKKKVN